MAKTKTKTTPKKKKPAPKSLRPATSKAVALVAKEKPQGGQSSSALSLANPSDVMAFGKVLKSYISSNKLSTRINNNDYAHVDGWKFAGMNFGLTAIPHKPVAKHVHGQYITTLYALKEFKGKDKKSYTKDVVIFSGFTEHTDVIEKIRAANTISKEVTRPYFAYETECDIVKLSNGVKVSYGVGFCSNLELLKAGFDEYSVNSMSQTRSIGKGFRNLLGFVMNAAGLEGTPAEEMDGVDRYEQENEHFQRAEPGKPLCSDFHFQKIIERANKGQLDLDEAKQHMTFTDEQLEAIEIAFQNAFKNQN